VSAGKDRVPSANMKWGTSVLFSNPLGGINRKSISIREDLKGHGMMGCPSCTQRQETRKHPTFYE
jgi:hypothetical protein